MLSNRITWQGLLDNANHNFLYDKKYAKFERLLQGAKLVYIDFFLDSF